jgi:leucine dehydrogenase
MGQLLHHAGYERVEMFEDPRSRLRCIIALHSTHLGPAAGGCRFWPYASTDGAIADALRLSRGMSYKNAMAGLPLGGGKSVIMRPEGPFDRIALFRAFGDAVQSFSGRYLTAEDVGTSIADMEVVHSRTRYVAGLSARPGRAGGDPSPWTAMGVFLSLQHAVQRRLGRGLDGVSVAIQGVGHVGLGLAKLLQREGTRLVIADANSDRARGVAAELGAALVDPGAAIRPDRVCHHGHLVRRQRHLGRVEGGGQGSVDRRVPRGRVKARPGALPPLLKHGTPLIGAHRPRLVGSK